MRDVSAYRDRLTVRRKESKHPGFVYLIGPANDRANWVKIGWAKRDVKRRLRDLQTASPFDLRIWAYFAGNEKLERFLHQIFAPLGIRGEWFHLNHKLLDFLFSLYPDYYALEPVPIEVVWEYLHETVCASAPGYSLDDANELAAWHGSADRAFLTRYAAVNGYAEQPAP